MARVPCPRTDLLKQKDCKNISPPSATFCDFPSIASPSQLPKGIGIVAWGNWEGMSQRQDPSSWKASPHHPASTPHRGLQVDPGSGLPPSPMSQVPCSSKHLEFYRTYLPAGKKGKHSKTEAECLFKKQLIEIQFTHLACKIHHLLYFI